MFNRLLIILAQSSYDSIENPMSMFATPMQLVDEAHLNPNVLADNQPTAPVQKRQYMGICMKKHYNNFIPVPCVRAGEYIRSDPPENCHLAVKIAKTYHFFKKIYNN